MAWYNVFQPYLKYSYEETKENFIVLVLLMLEYYSFCEMDRCDKSHKVWSVLDCLLTLLPGDAEMYLFLY